MDRLWTSLLRFVQDEDGPTAVEYAVMLALIVVVCIGAITALGTAANNTFNNVAGRNLNWFWNDWYFSNNYIDLAVASVTKARNGYSVVIDNIGGMDAPVDIRVKYTNGDSATFHQTPAIWEANQRRATVTIPATRAVSSLDLDGGIWMDADTTNNKWTRK